MKKIYIIIVIFCFSFLNAQIVNIPDSNFKAKLLSANPNNTIAATQISVLGNPLTHNIVDVNGDGEIQISEAQAILYLNVSDSNISNLTGIEQFSSLITLYCSSNQLQNINLSQNTALKNFNCSNNLLTNLDISVNQQLINFNCSNNLLSNLNISQNTNLENLNCSFNLLSSLNVSQNIALKSIRCENNQLSNINIAQNSILENFRCNNNQLTSLDVSQNNLLNSLICNNNQITNLDVSNLQYLWSLWCNNNQLTSLDVSNNNNLSLLLCHTNNLSILNIKNGNTVEFDFSNLSFDSNPNLEYICADEEDVFYVNQRIISYGYSSTCHVNSYCSFTPGGEFFEVVGNAKFDINNNGCDVTDINCHNLRFNISNSFVNGSIITDVTGNYYIPVQAGNHTITPNLENPSYFNVSPTSFTANFPTQTSPLNQNFCVTANGVKHDVEVVLIPTVPARPGFDATYKLVYRNKGNQVENGSISLTFDDARLDYVSSNPVYYSSAVNNFTWNYSNLQPFETREIAVVLNVNSPMETPPVNNGDVLNYATSITTTNTDETPMDNYFFFEQIVVGSYDPNDKTCLQGVSEDVMIIGDYVHYVIRFENTGTYPAENIVVKDMIDLNKFDIATLVPLKSSHDFFTRINGNKVEFIFENINLDFNDATNDGYVVFKIKTKPTLIVGDTFSNNANIYFDYNFPITTNTYTTTITALSNQNFDFGTYFTLYPNPTKDVLNIQSKQNVAINSVEIYNQLGQIVMATTNAINSIDVANLASGTYFVKINTEKGSANMKFMKE